MNPYFVAPNGQQQGPFTFAQLQAMMDAGQLNTTDLCWREGMPDWQSISTAIPALIRRISPSPVWTPGPATLNPYLPPQAGPSSYGGSSRHKKVGEYGGIGRSTYFCSFFLMQVFGGIIGYSFQQNQIFERYPYIQAVILAAGVLLGIILFSLRLKNTGTSRWMLLLFLVPFLNVLFGVALSLYMLIAPEGYADTRTLDGPGKVMAWIVGLFFGGLLLLMLFSVAAAFISR